MSTRYSGAEQEGGPAPAGGSKRRAFGPTSKRIVGAVAFISSLAGIISLVLAVADRPEPHTFRDWVREANAVCEENHGDVRGPLTEGVTLLREVVSPPVDGAVDPPDLQDVATKLENAADGRRKILAGLRRIEVPDGRQSDVDRALSLESDLIASLDGIAADLRSLDPSAPDVTTLLRLTTTMTELSVTVIPDWVQHHEEMSSTSCA